MAGWKTIAKNEIRLWTTFFRKCRKLFFYLITLLIIIVNIGVIIANIFIINPQNNSKLIEQFIFTFNIIPLLSGSPIQIQQAQILFLYTNIFSPLIIQLIPPIIEIISFFCFFMAFTYPIQTSIQQLNVGHFELILSAPIRAKDMLLGNFLGRVPIYIIGGSLLVPIFWTILSLFIPFPLISCFILTLITLWLFILGTFLGTIASSYISLKLGQSEGAADKAKVYLLLIGMIAAIPILSISLVPYAFIDPNIQYILKFIPTTWFGDIINSSISPNFQPIELLLLFIGLASIFTISVFFLGYKYGDRVYSLELGIQSETIRITQENRIYQFLRRLFGLIFVTQAKEFFRRKENIFRIFYGIVFAFIFPLSSTAYTNQNLDFFQILSGDVLPKEYPMLFTGWLLALMFGPMLGSMIMIRSKDMIWVFKKSPRGVSSLITSFIQVNYLLIFPITLPLIIINSFFYGYDILYSIIFFINTNIWIFSSLTISVAIQCWRPAFKERSPKMAVNILIMMGILVPIFFFLLELLEIFSVYAIIISPLILLLLSYGMIRFGIKKLNELE